MKLRLALLTVDLGFRFLVSATTVSSIFITWAKLMSKELSVLIVWPSRQQVKKTLPSCFRKLYPKLKSGALLTALSALRRLQVVLLWQQPYGVSISIKCYTFKVLVAITPNGAISYVSPCYEGRASDIFIVRNSGFLKMIEPFGEIMADGI